MQDDQTEGKRGKAFTRQEEHIRLGKCPSMVAEHHHKGTLASPPR